MQDIGEQQLLMLLLMMQTDLNDRSKLGQIIYRFDQPHHCGVDVTTVGSDFIGAWSCDQTPLLACVARPDRYIIGIVQIGETFIEDAITFCMRPQQELLEKPRDMCAMPFGGAG